MISVFRDKLKVLGIFTILVFLITTACEPSLSYPTPKSPSPTTAENRQPVIHDLNDDQPVVSLLGSSKIKCTASDPDGDTLTYVWVATGGNFTGVGASVTWMAPGIPGSYKITANVSDSKGGNVQADIMIKVVTNRDPVIAKIEANPTIVLPGNTSTLTCSASDPDGNDLFFTWGPSDGSIVGTGSQVTWVAPNKGGDQVIRVTVSDGKSGSVAGNVVVKVTSREKTVTLSLVENETGSVYWDGTISKEIKTGDDADNRGMRAYFSFNTIPVAGFKVIGAKLTFFVKEAIGGPLFTLGDLYIENVYYGAYALNRDVFYVSGGPIEKFYRTTPVEVDVTTPVTYAAAGNSPRLQIRARFDTITDGNHGNDYIIFSDAVLTVTYLDDSQSTPRP